MTRKCTNVKNFYDTQAWLPRTSDRQPETLDALDKTEQQR